MSDEAKEPDEIPSPMANAFASALLFAKALGELNCKPRVLQLEIDGLMYTSTKLSASVGLDLWPRVTALLGAGLARAIATGSIAAVDANALLRVADRAMRDGLLPLVRDLLQRMQCGKLHSTGKPGKVLDDFDEHFAGEYGHLLRVCAFALIHNLRGPTYGGR